MKLAIQHFVDARTDKERKAYQTIEQQRADAQVQVKPTMGVIELGCAIRQRWPDRLIQRAAIRKLVKRMRELIGE